MREIVLSVRRRAPKPQVCTLRGIATLLFIANFGSRLFEVSDVREIVCLFEGELLRLWKSVH